MARIRTVKPEFWTDERLAKVSRDARLLFIALFNLAEDHGVARANLAYLKGQAFPYDDVSTQKIGKWVQELEQQGLVRRFGFNGELFLFIVNFAKHQKIDRPTKPTLPNPPNFEEILDEGCGNVPQSSREIQQPSLLERKGKEGKGSEGIGGASATPPSSVPLIYETPAKPPEDWGGEEFFQWAQSRRIASGLLGEKYPRFEKLRSWWVTVVQSGVGVERLQEAFYAFGTDKYWERPEVNPAHPWAAFQKEWAKYVRQEAA